MKKRDGKNYGWEGDEFAERIVRVSERLRLD